jgi:hypothetical protein
MLAIINDSYFNYNIKKLEILIGTTTKGVLKDYRDKLANEEIHNIQPVLHPYFIIDYLETEEKTYLINYIKKGLMPYIVLLIFGIITLISFFVFCSCCCKPSLFCKKEENDKEKWKNLAFKIVVVTSFLSGLLCILGNYYSM